MTIPTALVDKSKIDWKKIAKSPGYKSLKAAYIKDAQSDHARVRKGFCSFRGKPELRRYFKKAIGLAMKYAHKNGENFEIFLNRCEQKRNYNWLNYYQNHEISRV